MVSRSKHRTIQLALIAVLALIALTIALVVFSNELATKLNINKLNEIPEMNAVLYQTTFAKSRRVDTRWLKPQTIPSEEQNSDKDWIEGKTGRQSNQTHLEENVASYSELNEWPISPDNFLEHLDLWKTTEKLLSYQASCKSLPTSTDEFTVELCTRVNDCYDSYLKVQRKKCFESNRQISPSEESQSFLKTMFGPDFFVVEALGPQLLASPVQLYLRDCRYLIPLQFTLAGEYRINMTLTHEDYNAVDEWTDQWPPYLGTLILQDLSLNICSQFPKATLSASAQRQLSDSINSCSKHDRWNGLWIRTKFIPDERTPFIDPATVPCYQNYVYRPLCSLVFTKACDEMLKHSNRNANYTMWLFGDSQTRTNFDGLRRRWLPPSKFRFTFGWDQQASFRLPNGRLDTYYNLNFTGEQHGEWLAFDAQPQDFAHVDALVVNFGQWPASGLKVGGHKSVQFYAERVFNVSLKLLQIKRELPHLKIVWTGVNPFPATDTQMVQKYADWRTLARMTLFDAVARLFMGQVGIPVTDHHRLFKPVFCRSADHSHFRGPEMDHGLDEILFKLDICLNAPSI